MRTSHIASKKANDVVYMLYWMASQIHQQSINTIKPTGSTALEVFQAADGPGPMEMTILQCVLTTAVIGLSATKSPGEITVSWTISCIDATCTNGSGRIYLWLSCRSCRAERLPFHTTEHHYFRELVRLTRVDAAFDWSIRFQAVSS